jgi:hypothetical protein
MKMNENKKDQLAKANESINKVNWKEFAGEYLLAQGGTKVIVWKDGTITTMGTGTAPHPEVCEYILHIFTPLGINNVDTDVYIEGWAHYDNTGNIVVDDTGEIIDIKEAVQVCIDDGDINDWIEGWKESILDSIRNSEVA